MAVIQGKDGYTVDVDGPNALGLNIYHGVREVYGAYRASGVTGAVVAPTTGGYHFFIRNGGLSAGTLGNNTGMAGLVVPRKMFITSLRVNYFVSAATTVHSPVCYFALVRVGSTTAVSGGTQLLARPFSKKPLNTNNAASTFAAAQGDVRVNTTTAGGLTVTTVPTGQVTEILPFALFPQPLTAPAIGVDRTNIVEMNGAYDVPLEVPQGGGLGFQFLTAATPTTHGMVLMFEVAWFEGV